MNRSYDSFVQSEGNLSCSSLQDINNFNSTSSAAKPFHKAFHMSVMLLLAVMAGCGNQYRPTVTPINPTGPSAQPTAQLVVISQPGMDNGAIIPSNCMANAYADPGVTTVIDFSGDSVMAQAQIGYGPLTFALASGGTSAYSLNTDCSVSNISATTTLQTKAVQTSTLLSGLIPINALSTTSSLYVVQQNVTTPGADSVGQFTGSPEKLQQTISVDPVPVNIVGATSAQRVYAISQGDSDGASPQRGDCDNPSAVTATGMADAIETATNTATARIPLGVCPVYGMMTPDTLRTFILNRGSGTVTVINSQLNALDSTNNLSTGGGMNGSGTITVGAGPIYVDYYAASQILATANYDSGTVSFIDASTDIYGNDSPTFGRVIKTVTVGAHPVDLSILQDGSRVYVACQGSNTSSIGTAPGSVYVINLPGYNVEKSIPLTINPRSIASIYNYPIGKVYVSSQNSSNLTIIRTDTDVISSTVGIQGNIVDIRASSPYPGASAPTSTNYITNSRSIGSGMP
uniref:YncE family protein n=1 Tax=Paracidobacterium acidisoli TaxID=2303751 RepID=A0A372IRF1_9BACT